MAVVTDVPSPSSWLNSHLRKRPTSVHDFSSSGVGSVEPYEVRTSEEAAVEYTRSTVEYSYMEGGPIN
eukprot:6022998-Pyramimonas_sp.AAC.2